MVKTIPYVYKGYIETLADHFSYSAHALAHLGRCANPKNAVENRAQNCRGYLLTAQLDFQGVRERERGR